MLTFLFFCYCASAIREHFPLTCYRPLRFLRFSGTSSLYLLPNSSIPLVMGHMFPLLVTELFDSSGFRAHVPLTCYRILCFLRFSGTCSPYLLPNFSIPLVLGHMFPLLVTEFFASTAFRAYVPLTCYRTLRFLWFWGTCSPYLLPNSSIPPFFGHMFPLLVTELFASSAFRAHVPLTCYRTLRFLWFWGTYSPYLLPNSSIPPLFGHMFPLLVTELFASSVFRAHVSFTCYRTLCFLRFSGTCSPYLLPNSSLPPLFGHMFPLLVTELFDSSVFRAHVPLTCYRTLRFLWFWGTCSPYLLPNSSLPLVLGHMYPLLVTELFASTTFRAHVPLTCYRTFRFLRFWGTCSPYLLPNFSIPPLLGHMFPLLLPNSSLPLVLGHMFPLLVTDLFASSVFRAHVPLTCYRTLRFLRF